MTIGKNKKLLYLLNKIKKEVSRLENKGNLWVLIHDLQYEIEHGGNDDY